MSKFYRMIRKVPGDGAIVYKRSHNLVRFKTGEALESDFSPPLILDLDPEFPDGRMPTFFESPALIGKKTYYQDLLAAGATNIEAAPALIRHPNGNQIHDYLLLNVIGRVSCVDLKNSKYRRIGPGMTVIDQSPIKPELIGNLQICVVDEDTDFIIVSESIYRALSNKNYEDILFTELATSASGAVSL